MALSAGKQVRRLTEGSEDTAPQKGNTTIYRAGIVMLDASGYANPGATATGCIGVGVGVPTDLDRFANTGADGSANVRYEEGTFPFNNSASADAFSVTDQPGIPVFIVDDATVAKTSGGNTRSPAGRLHHVDSAGVWVTMGQERRRPARESISQSESPSGFLTASDVRAIKNVAGHNGAGACTAVGAKVGDVVIGISFAKAPTAAAGTQAGLTAFESTISVAGQIQQTGVANLSSEAFDVLLLAQS